MTSRWLVRAVEPTEAFSPQIKCENMRFKSHLRNHNKAIKKIYQKQFHFLVENNIETTAQLKIFKENAENKMSALTHNRSRLYSKADPTIEIKTINAELREVRKNIRICNNIFQDIETIREHQNYVIWLEQEAEKDKKRRYLGKER